MSEQPALDGPTFAVTGSQELQDATVRPDVSMDDVDQPGGGAKAEAIGPRASHPQQLPGEAPAGGAGAELAGAADEAEGARPLAGEALALCSECRGGASVRLPRRRGRAALGSSRPSFRRGYSHRTRHDAATTPLPLLLSPMRPRSSPQLLAFHGQRVVDSDSETFVRRIQRGVACAAGLMPP